MIYRSAHLIANNVAIVGVLPVEIGSGVVLRRPDERELARIRELVSAVASSGVVPYEYERSPDNENEFSLTERDKWRYFVLSDDDGGSGVHGLEPALLLLKPTIELSIRVMSSVEDPSQPSTSLGYAPAQPHIIERYHYGATTLASVVVSAELFREAEELRLKLAALPEEFAFIARASEMNKELRIVPHRSRLQVIGYFSIIESLLAHKPRLPESLDSISYQLEGKLQLLCNEAGLQNVVAHHFGAVVKIWKRLYSYRSAVAHGDAVDFRGEFSSLKSVDNVVQFLAEFIKDLMLFALDRPRLVKDLKSC